MAGTIRRVEPWELKRGQEPHEDEWADIVCGLFHWHGHTYSIRGDRIVEIAHCPNYDGAVLVREIEMTNFRLSIDRDYWTDAEPSPLRRRMVDCTIHIDDGPNVPFTISAEDFYDDQRLMLALLNVAGRSLAFRASDLSRIRNISVHFRNHPIPRTITAQDFKEE